MGVIIFLAVVFSLYGHRFHGYAVILWWVIFVFFAFFNRSTLLLFWRSVKT
jgi:hypothetical protein